MGKGRPTSWLLGFAGSALAHVCVLAALFAFGRDERGRLAAADPVPESITLGPAEAVSAVPDPLAAAIPIDVAPPAPATDAPQADRDSLVPSTMAPSDSDGRHLLAPAPDHGAAGGHPPDHSFRRDESTLRSRLTDGAAESQPARTRTSGRPASPQAIRREPVVGIGDSVHSKTPRRAPSPAPASAVALAGPTGGQTGTPGELPAGEAPLPPPSAELAAATVPDRGTGPLDAEQGARSFDIERPGKAADDDTMRAASNELHPGLTDFDRPSAPARTAAAEGKGPGVRAGAVARPANGTAPSELGAPDREASAADIEQRARARQYARYEQEIKRRVAKMFEFPKALALRLEQGVTIVYFVVGTDGRVADGPRVVKSSGFEEFDSAAIRMVRRAAPFPPMPHIVPMSMSVIFDNPVIR
ncbi:MAG TPA: TonB family protein [Polyangia bacterium]|nr:TonB family protein [Polyangia bacterium]